MCNAFFPSSHKKKRKRKRLGFGYTIGRSNYVLGGTRRDGIRLVGEGVKGGGPMGYHTPVLVQVKTEREEVARG
jgi:hypothetical protein